MLQTVECTNNIDVDLVWENWLYVLRLCKKIKCTLRNLPPRFYSEVRRLKEKQAGTKKFNKGHPWNKLGEVRN